MSKQERNKRLLEKGFINQSTFDQSSIRLAKALQKREEREIEDLKKEIRGYIKIIMNS